MDIENQYPSIGEYDLIKTLGAGYNAKVKLGKHKLNENYYAVKVIKQTNISSNEKAIQNEVNILKSLQHPNIVNLIEFHKEGQYKKRNGSTLNVMYMVEELAPGGELFEYVANTGKFSEEISRTYYKQLLNALSHMHSKGIAHRDLKPENLLFDGNYNLKVADFGFSTFLDRQLSTCLGTESYMAPEINERQPYDGPTVDLFAATIILFIMYSGQPAFSKAEKKDPYYRLLCTGKHDTFWKAHAKHKPENFYNESFRDLVNKMLSYNPQERLPIDKLLQHPWVQGPELDIQAIQKEFMQRDQIVKDGLEKEKLQKKLMKEQQKKMQQQKPGGVAFSGAQKFRAGENEQESLEEAQKKILTEFPSLNNERKMQKYDENIFKPVNMKSCENENTLLAFICGLGKQNLGNVALNDKQFKVTLKDKEDNEDQVEMVVKICKIDESVNVIDFTKKSGETMAYFNKVNKLKQDLEQVFK